MNILYYLSMRIGLTPRRYSIAPFPNVTPCVGMELRNLLTGYEGADVWHVDKIIWDRNQVLPTLDISLRPKTAEESEVVRTLLARFPDTQDQLIRTLREIGDVVLDKMPNTDDLNKQFYEALDPFAKLMP
jgi:hypothetical protein